MSEKILSEFDLIAELTQDLPRQAEGLLWGMGDDCAVISGNGRRDWLLTTDSMIEHVDFERHWATWTQIGRKSVLAAASDVAAMGGRSRFVLVSLGVPDDLRASDVHELYTGIRAGCGDVQAMIVGGDTSRSPRALQISITVIGDVRHGGAIYRRGARPRDAVYVTGTLGGSAAGLAVLQKNLHIGQEQAAQQDFAHFIARHMNPPLRAEVGQWLASSGCVTSMIDVSDGLLADLGHIARASNCGMKIEGLRVPLFSGLSACVHGLEQDPLLLATTGGEEYELAFTVAAARIQAFERFAAAAERHLRHPITRVGTVTDTQQVTLIDPAGMPIAVPQQGYVHAFRS